MTGTQPGDPRDGEQARVRYGELMGDAGSAIWAATTSLATTRLPDAATAANTITAWRDLLEACRRHGWALLGTDLRVQGIRETGGTRPVDRAAVDLVDRLATLTHPHHGRATPDVEPVEAQPPGEVAERLATARRTLGAATDLLATHRRTDGTAATPDATSLDDPDVCAAGYRRLAELTILTLSSGDALALRAGQAGMTWTRVAPAVPDTSALVDAAVTLRGLALADRADPTRLDRFEVARPRIRTDQPLAELADRVARLRRVAWAASQQPAGDVGVTALADIANTAVALHQATETLLTATRHPAVRGPGGEPRHLKRIHEAGKHWLAATEQLAKLRSTTPGHLGIRRDAHRIRGILTALLDDPPGDPAALPTLLRLCDAQPDVAHWTATALRGLATSGGLYMHGRALSGEQVSNTPDLVPAKLQDRLVPAPLGTWQTAEQALLRVSAAVSPEDHLRIGRAAPSVHRG